MEKYAVLLFFILVGALIVGGAILASRLLSPKTPKTKIQQEAYECGIPTEGSSRIQFRVGFYIFALLFLIFDIESLFLFPAASIFSETMQGGAAAVVSPVVLLVELGVFLLILLLGLAYAWRKGALKWE